MASLRPSEREPVATSEKSQNTPGSVPKTPRKRPTATRKAPLSRRRPAKRKDAVSEVAVIDRSPTAQAPSTRREPSRYVEQLGVIALALVCSVIGFAVHAFWLASIVLMAILFGLVAAELRSARGRGVISEVMSEARVITEEVTSGRGSDSDPPVPGGDSLPNGPNHTV
jgi:hypothetical protein